MKKLLLITCLILGQIGFGQIYGDIAIDKRPVVKQIEYGIPASYSGQIVFDIIVDEAGDVTSCKINKAKTDVKSTPTIMKAKNRIVMELKFKAGSIYPQFHRGEVVIKVYKK